MVMFLFTPVGDSFTNIFIMAKNETEARMFIRADYAHLGDVELVGKYGEGVTRIVHLD